MRVSVEKLFKALNKPSSNSNGFTLSNKLVDELKIKFKELPNSLADIESELMNFSAQLSCQGTIKDDVSRMKFIFFFSKVYTIDISSRLFACFNKSSKN